MAVTTESKSVTQTVDFGTWRIVPEQDPIRNRKEPFSPIRQSAFWLLNGENANVVDRTRAKEPFAITLATDEEKEAYAKGITGMMWLYAHQFVATTLEDGTNLVIGKPVFKKGKPMLVIREEEGKRTIYHFWQESQMVRDTRLS